MTRGGWANKLEDVMVWLGPSFAEASAAASEIADHPWSRRSPQALRQARADVAVLDR